MRASLLVAPSDVASTRGSGFGLKSFARLAGFLETQPARGRLAMAR